MVKLATVRDRRRYGPRRWSNLCEFINAGVYLFAVVLLIGGLGAQLSGAADRQPGLGVLLAALAMLAAVNLHDLIAHMVGIEYRWSLLRSDLQLLLVELAVPSLQALGCVLVFLALVFVLLQEKKQHEDDSASENQALSLLVAGPALWVIASILNLCRYYERAGGHVQALQNGVQIPFLLGSFFFTVGGIVNRQDDLGGNFHGVKLLRKSWVYCGVCGGLMFLVGGIVNLMKVFKMQRMEGRGLEKLRGAAQDWLRSSFREEQVPLLLEQQRRRRTEVEEPPVLEQWRRRVERVETPPPPSREVQPVEVPTPYKDVLLSQP